MLSSLESQRSILHNSRKSNTPTEDIEHLTNLTSDRILKAKVNTTNSYEGFEEYI